MTVIKNAEKIRSLLNNYTRDNKDHWSFRGSSKREHAHAFIQYPAMMVPQMQGELISMIKQVEPGIRSIYDPFVGSGTVMTEAMINGLDFVGNDINPLALLICKAKKGPFFVKALEDKISDLIDTIDRDKSEDIAVTFVNRDKWFREDNAIELSKIRRAIQAEPSKWCRRLFWLALAESVRLTGNSRTSTFKLHIRPEDEIANRDISPIDVFKEIIESILEKFSALTQILKEKDLIQSGHYTGEVTINLQDSKVDRRTRINDQWYDLLVTSPPYGDNNTTVPYGQYSYLPLQWIDFKDIEDRCDSTWLCTTHEIDRRSLGGTKSNALKEINHIRAVSHNLDQMLDDLKNEPHDRAVRVAAFYRDMDLCLDPILSRLKPKGYMIWTLGNRRVANKQVPMDDILSELLISRGAKMITKFHRDIPSKRTAPKNNIADTMTSETVLIMQKGNN